MPKSTTKRVDAVFIRKSSDKQDENGQIDNVSKMLSELGVNVPRENWIVGTIKRRHVRTDPGFARLLELVEADRIGTIYVESQDRWGTADRCELFSLIGTLRWHDTRLFDLRFRRDLTERDIGTELNVFVGSVKSEQELNDISYRSLRTRVNNFKASGSWPTGTHPFGYGKACHMQDGTLLWEWHPISRSKGQQYVPDGKKLIPTGPPDKQIQRKAPADRITLVPNRNREFVDCVRLIFDLYTRVGLSRRQISARLNEEERKFYTRPFSHTFVTQILTNPAYIGETHFGKMQSGELHTFDEEGLVISLKPQKKRTVRKRDVENRIIQKGTHEPLITEKTWKLAQQKLASEKLRTSFSPRNPAYFLKQIFVCGHCGKNLTGRTERHPTTGERCVVYVCTSYITGRINGHKSTCGYHRITHADAERMLLDKVERMGLDFQTIASQGGRENLQRRLANLGHEDEATLLQWEQWIAQGIDAFSDFINESGLAKTWPELRKLKKQALDVYLSEPDDELPKKLQRLRESIRAAEDRSVTKAKEKVQELRDELAGYTRNWSKTDNEMVHEVMRKQMDELSLEIQKWEPRTSLLSDRLESLYRAEAEREQERKQLVQELPGLDARERGEAFRRLFQSVTLYWDQAFHPSTTPPGLKKTSRPGRFSYTLRHDLIEWHFPESKLECSSWKSSQLGRLWALLELFPGRTTATAKM